VNDTEQELKHRGLNMKDSKDCEIILQSIVIKMINKGTKDNSISTKKSSSTIMKPLLRLSSYDVICGRHKDACNNIGNRRFRIIVALSAEKYMYTPTRAHKSLVIRDIVDAIHSSGGRFLQQCKFMNASTWEELDEKQVYDKVGHALRDMSSSWKEKTDVINLLCPNQTTSTTRSLTVTSKPETNIKSLCSNIVTSIPLCVSSSQTNEPCEYSSSNDVDDDDCTFMFDDDFDDLTNYSLSLSTAAPNCGPCSTYVHIEDEGLLRIQRDHLLDSVAVTASSIICL
jgi:hypothetical protein